MAGNIHLSRLNRNNSFLLRDSVATSSEIKVQACGKRIVTPSIVLRSIGYTKSHAMKNFERYEVVRCKITGQKMMIKDVINKGDNDEKYNCKYHNRSNGSYEYIHKTAGELEPYKQTTVGFKSNEHEN
jgi:hypothetical protein